MIDTTMHDLLHAHIPAAAAGRWEFGRSLAIFLSVLGREEFDLKGMQDEDGRIFAGKPLCFGERQSGWINDYLYDEGEVRLAPFFSKFMFGQSTARLDSKFEESRETSLRVWAKRIKGNNDPNHRFVRHMLHLRVAAHSAVVEDFRIDSLKMMIAAIDVAAAEMFVDVADRMPSWVYGYSALYSLRPFDPAYADHTANPLGNFLPWAENCYRHATPEARAVADRILIEAKKAVELLLLVFEKEALGMAISKACSTAKVLQWHRRQLTSLGNALKALLPVFVECAKHSSSHAIDAEQQIVTLIEKTDRLISDCQIFFNVYQRLERQKKREITSTSGTETPSQNHLFDKEIEAKKREITVLSPADIESMQKDKGLNSRVKENWSADCLSNLLKPLELVSYKPGALLPLRAEFPWLKSLVDTIEQKMEMRSSFGISHVHFEPLLLAGLPGGGKTYFCVRLAELMGIPSSILTLAGAHTSMALMGVERGWSTAQPSAPLELIARHGKANGLMIIDELGRALADGNRRNGNIGDALTQMLEPSTAKRYRDNFLCANIDISYLSWIFTSNSIENIDAALLSRMTVLYCEQPKPEHYPAILESLYRKLATEWRVPDVRFVPRLDGEEVAFLQERVRSIRELVTVASKLVADRVLDEKRFAAVH